MRITDVRVIVTCPGRNYVLVKVLTDEGLYGVGDGTLAGNEAAVAEVLRHARELLIGHDAGRIEDIWQLLYHHAYWRRGPIQMSALGAIDVALWDIKAKQAGLPLYQLLGGRSRSGVMCYEHADGREPAEVEANVRAYLERGFKVVRAQMGGYGGAGMLRHDPPAREGLPPVGVFEPARYLIETPKLFEYLRDRLGDEVELCHDAHEQLTPIEACWLAKRLEPFRLFFLEDPLRPDHKESFRMVRAASATPLAMGELFVSRWDCLPLFVEQLIDYIRIAPIHVGGITEARKICTLAEPYQIKTAHHGAADIGPIGQAAAVHLDLAIPNFGVLEWIEFPPQAYDVMPGACTIKDGYAHPNEVPGHGVDINEALAAKYPYQRAFMPLVRRRDGTVHVY